MLRAWSIRRKKIDALFDFAAEEFRGLRPHSKGGTQRSHEDALRRMGAKIPEREKVAIPVGLEYLFRAYKNIRFAKVKSNLTPLDSLSFQSIYYYMQATGERLSPIEVGALLSIDAIFNKASE